MFDLESARLFLRVLESGSISKASQETYLAKSMVKRRMDDLEAFVGTPLLTRGPHGVHATAAGEVFASHVRDLLQSIDDMRMACLQAASCGEGGRTIRVAYYSDFVFPAVQYVCDHYAACYPRDTVIPVFTRFQDAHRGVRSGLFDVAMCTQPSATDAVGLTCTQLYATRMVGLVLAQGPLADKASLSREDLAAHLVAVHPMWCPRDKIEAWSHGDVEFEVTIDEGGGQSMQGTIVAGGIYLYPETDACLFPYRALPLDDPICATSVLAYREDAAPAVLDFVQAARDYLMPYASGESMRLMIDWSSRPGM